MQEETQIHKTLEELLTTEGNLINNIKQFLMIVNTLKTQIKLSKDLSLRLYFDTISRIYTQLLELLELTCLHELLKQYPTLESIQANTNTIIKTLYQALIEQQQAEYLSLILSAVANNRDFFINQLLKFSEAIKSLYQDTPIQNKAEISNIVNTANQGDIIQYFTNHLIAPVQRLAKYPLFFQQLIQKSKPQRTDEHNKKLTLPPNMQTVIGARNQAAPSKRRAESIIQALNEHVLLNTQAANQALSPQHEKTAPYIPSRQRIPTMGLVGHNTFLENGAPNPVCNKLQVLKLENEKNENAGTQLIVQVLKLLTAHYPKMSKWQSQTKRLYYQLYEIYYCLRNCDHRIILELIDTYIKETQSSKLKIQDINFLAELKKLLGNNQIFLDKVSHGSEQKLPVDDCDVNLDIVKAHEIIRQPILDQILEIMQGFQKYSSGGSLTYPSELEVKISAAIYDELRVLKNQLGNYTVKSENFWIDVVKIFQHHTHIAGEFPHYFYHSRFGHMLRQIAFQLDQFKPAECRHAFELITAPEGYHYTDFNKVSGHILAIGKEHRTSARLCYNVQRIMDFYCNTGLGKLVAEDVQSQKLNLNQGWRKLIMSLDEKITQLYLNQTSNFEHNTLSEMIQEIKAAASNIRSHYFRGRHSRLAGSLESLARLFEGESLPAERYQEIKHLPAGIITSAQELDSFKIESYLKQHIVQRACSPFINYYENTAHRFFKRTAPAKLRHTNAVTKQLNQFYQDPPITPELTTENTNQPIESDEKNQQFKDRIKFFAQKQLLKDSVKLYSTHGNSVTTCHDYLKNIGVT